MGVPKFYRWISERYPCLSEVVKEYQIPDFDNLYLDMNGIIHTCSHPNDDDPHFRISEEKIFAGICHYIDFLFKMIKPKKVFFMAVDGVAPRAKMNQQRGRRFRTAKTAIILEDRAKALGESLPTEARFDSNCITPGTEFMARLHSVLKRFVIYKISTDILWREIRVYLSGHETPGEGEHKIMDFIRYEKSQPGYNPNTRHCLYGLDADLIMLGLCSHEPYFSLLREEVKFGGKKTQKRIMTPEETTFHLLHISLLRDYLYHEFFPVKEKISFKFSVESIVDDFVLMSFLVGNDFIPHLPQLHIHHDALPVLFKTYINVLPMLDGYINEQGYLNLDRFEKFLNKLSEYDFKKFGELNDDFQYLENKSKVKHTDKTEIEKVSTSDFLLDLGFSDMVVSKMAEYDSLSDDDDSDNYSSEDGCSTLELEFVTHKTDYYKNKLEFDEVTPEVLQDQAEGYVRAIQWNLHYYYNGVISWSWYYPHHYSPYISDVKNFKSMEMKFELGKPFLPFQQLLAVLPKLSKDLLPKSYQKLMCDKDSPLIDFYPDDFDTDLNGKQQEWEAIVLIPFINEKLLLKFAAIADQDLNEEERKRNCHGPHLLYTYDIISSGSLSSFLPGHYPDLNNTHYKLKVIEPDFFRLPIHLIVKGLCQGVVLDKVILGFPTLKTLKHTAELKNEKVKVFQMVSQKENMMLNIEETRESDLQKVAEEVIGKTIFVGWPHLKEAFVVAVSDGVHQILFDKSKSLNGIAFLEKEMTLDECNIWTKQVETVKERNYQRWGIFTGMVKILVHAKCLSGIRFVCSKEGKVINEKQWDNTLSNFALQTTVSNIDTFSPDVCKAKHPAEIFYPGSTVFILAPSYYGSKGTVLTHLKKFDGTISVDVELTSEPDFRDLIHNKKFYISEHYKSGYFAAQELGIESFLMSRLTGTFLIQTSQKGKSNPNFVNVGLNLKFNRKNEEVVGLTKKKDNQWLYSEKAIKLLNAYLAQFPTFFEKLAKFLKNDVIYLEDLYPDGGGNEVINKITNWLKSQSSASAERQKCGTRRLDAGIVFAIEEIIDSTMKDDICHVKKKIPPHQLYNPYMCKGLTKPDPTVSFNLFDRVINVSYASCVPLGLRGTIIGITAEENESDTMYEIVFDKEFSGGLALSCSYGKGYRLPGHALINITHGYKGLQKYLPYSPAKHVKGNAKVDRAAVFDAVSKHLQLENPTSVAQRQMKKPELSPIPNKPFYNVTELFQTKPQDVSAQTQVFSNSIAETSNKTFVTPKADVASNFTGKILVKQSTPNSSRTNYQNFWADLKRNTPESPSRNPNKPNYGQKVSVTEVLQSVKNQNAAVYVQSSNILPNEHQLAHASFVELLIRMCITHFNAPPVYSYHKFGNTHFHIATITLPNGTKITGVPCQNKNEAAEDTAEKALASLRSVIQPPSNINIPQNLVPNNMQKDRGYFVRPPQVYSNEFHPPLLGQTPTYSQQPIFHFDSSRFEGSLMRHPSPVHSTLMPDSFVASNQMLLNYQTQSSPVSTIIPKQQSVIQDSNLFYLPGGGTARIKNSSKCNPVQQINITSNSSMFVPPQVLKQAVKTPFDTSGLSNSEWPDLPSKSDVPNVSKNAHDSESVRTTPSTVSKSERLSSSVKPSPPKSSTMTVLGKKPKRRIAAKFQFQ